MISIVDSHETYTPVKTVDSILKHTDMRLCMPNISIISFGNPSRAHSPVSLHPRLASVLITGNGLEWIKLAEGANVQSCAQDSHIKHRSKLTHSTPMVSRRSG